MSRVPRGLLAGRYLLETSISGVGEDAWLATDEVLGRTVVITLDDGSSAAAEHEADPIVSAGVITDARWLRILDTGEVDQDGVGRRFVVSEWLDLPTLSTLHSRRELSPHQLIRAVSDTCLALEALEAAGYAQPALRDTDVLLGSDGRARLRGLARAVPVTPTGHADHAQAVARLLDLAPRRSRAPVNRRLRQLAMQLRDSDRPDLATVRRELAALPDRDVGRSHQSREVTVRWLWRLIPPLLAIAIATGAWIIGKHLGQLPTTTNDAEPVEAVPAPAATQPHDRVVWSTPPRITAFGDISAPGRSATNPGSAVDDDPGSVWSTPQFSAARPGGPQHGIGLLLDLRHPQSVTAAQLLLASAGADLQIRAGNRRPARPSDLPLVVARRAAPAATQISLPHRVRARYWLVFFTSLPASGHGYRLGVAEVALLAGR